ncbi:NHLP bacteriocin system secretion protein [bacterium]|nr:NHLP bacteriocin system secretion protein [bacterium]
MPKSTFRNAALSRLSSPEELDLSLKITKPTGWLALLGLALILAGVICWSILGTISVKVKGQGVIIYPGGLTKIQSMKPGKVVSIKANEGDVVVKGNVIAIISVADASGNTKTEEITTPFTGRVVELDTDEGEFIIAGGEIMHLEKISMQFEPLEVVAYVPISQGKKISPKMHAAISPTTINREKYGFIHGQVKVVSEFAITEKGMMRVLNNKSLVETFSTNQANLQVFISMDTDNETFSGYKWSSSKGPEIKLTSGTLCNIEVEIAKVKPISLIVPWFDKD